MNFPLKFWGNRNRHTGNFILKGEFWAGFSENGHVLARRNRDGIYGGERGAGRTIILRPQQKMKLGKCMQWDCCRETPRRQPKGRKLHYMTVSRPILWGHLSSQLTNEKSDTAAFNNLPAVTHVNSNLASELRPKLGPKTSPAAFAHTLPAKAVPRSPVRGSPLQCFIQQWREL